jgi:hypothetical protein
MGANPTLARPLNRFTKWCLIAFGFHRLIGGGRLGSRGVALVPESEKSCIE